MHTFIELWNAKPAWTALARDEKQRFMDQVGAGMQALSEAGVEVIGWGTNRDETDARASFEFFAVWTTPGPAELTALTDAVAGSGWYDYFEQVNVSGELEPPPAVIARHLEL